MTSDHLPGPAKNVTTDIAASHPEVEFALVLARTIDFLQADPEQLRSAIYELARHKLQQISDEDPAEKTRLMQALEVAIAGVESHAQKNPTDAFPQPATARLPGSRPEWAPKTAAIERVLGDIEERTAPRRINEDSQPAIRAGAQKRLASTPVRVFAVFLFFAAVVVGIVVLRRDGGLSSFHGMAPSVPAASPSPAPGPPPQTAQVTPPPPRDPNLPTSYGVYAQAANHLYELQLLPGRVPDPRVAISAAITKPGETKLPDGRPRFIVFQRDAAADVFDVVEVRIIARVKQATSFDASGKPVVSGDDDWVIRNISIPMKATPLKDDPMMYEVRPRDPNFQFTPGRYALVIKGRAFDFLISGAVTDKQQCLERLVAANGTFYSQCQKP